jgi:hypothetical protein
MPDNTERTQAIIDYLKAAIVKAEAEAPQGTGVVRECGIRAARDGEWHTLFALLTVPELRAADLVDGMMIAGRLDELMAEMRARSPAPPAGYKSPDWRLVDR